MWANEVQTMTVVTSKDITLMRKTHFSPLLRQRAKVPREDIGGAWQAFTLTADTICCSMLCGGSSRQKNASAKRCVSVRGSDPYTWVDGSGHVGGETGATLRDRVCHAAPWVSWHALALLQNMTQRNPYRAQQTGFVFHLASDIQ